MEVTLQAPSAQSQENGDYLKWDYWLPVCQCCNQFFNINQQAYKDLVSSDPRKFKQLLADEDSTPEAIDQVVIPETFEEFCIRLTDIFDIDFPLCPMCMKNECKTIGKKSLAVKEIIGKIQTAIGQIYSNSTKSPTTVEETLGPSDEEMKKKISEYPQMIAELKNKITQLYNQRLFIQKNKEEITEIENELLDQYSAIYSQITELKRQENEAVLVNDSLHSSLEDLKHSNVFNDTYFIWFNGPVGLINNFPLGKYPNKNPDYVKMNCAFNELVNCIYTISIITRIRTTASIQPCGADSKIVLKNEASYTLNLNPQKANRKDFLIGYKYFIGCVQELTQRMKEKYAIDVPYEITDTMIGGYDYNMSDLDVWTHAMKLLLIDVKKLYIFTIVNRENKPTPIEL